MKRAIGHIVKWKKYVHTHAKRETCLRHQGTHLQCQHLEGRVKRNSRMFSAIKRV